ncbi:MAG: haloacid dehalogenase-like hydrolase [Prevotella sp.]|nr:haloacid dehalogenase-like hydrolase [Prevotella sp.]
MKVYAFDFDGTLTTSDTLLAFIGHVCGRGGLVWALLRHAHLLVAMKLGLYSNERAKEHVFAHCFKGMSEADFERHCVDFAASHRHLLRPEAMKTLRQALDEGAQVVVVSASIDRWVEPFFADLTTRPLVLCTRIEVSEGRLTGRFEGHNCYGAEKVRRLEEALPPRKEYSLVAFGDSQGDRELLNYADEAHYKPFRT